MKRLTEILKEFDRERFTPNEPASDYEYDYDSQNSRRSETYGYDIEDKIWAEILRYLQHPHFLREIKEHCEMVGKNYNELKMVDDIGKEIYKSETYKQVKNKPWAEMLKYAEGVNWNEEVIKAAKKLNYLP